MSNVINIHEGSGRYIESAAARAIRETEEYIAEELRREALREVKALRKAEAKQNRLDSVDKFWNVLTRVVV